MTRTIKKYFLHSFVVLLAIAGLASCTLPTMDEGYKNFIKNGEISYTGKIDSLTIFSGRNRVQVNGLFMADRKITECRIFWNNKQDSLVVPVTRTQGIDPLMMMVGGMSVPVVIDGLEENIYNFEVRTYDILGNNSIAVTSIGKVYGERYQLSLINRPLIISTIANPNPKLVGADLTINFATMDLSTGVYKTEITYIDNSDVSHTVSVPIADGSGVLSDYKIGSEYSYRTLFLPDPSCIDIFYSVVNTGTKL